jgi:hypothetical protein
LISLGFGMNGKEPRGTDNDREEAPETPTDEQRPPQVQDPPPLPEPKGPYTVARSFASQTEAHR